MSTDNNTSFQEIGWDEFNQYSLNDFKLLLQNLGEEDDPNLPKLFFILSFFLKETNFENDNEIRKITYRLIEKWSESYIDSYAHSHNEYESIDELSHQILVYETDFPIPIKLEELKYHIDELLKKEETIDYFYSILELSDSVNKEIRNLEIHHKSKIYEINFYFDYCLYRLNQCKMYTDYLLNEAFNISLSGKKDTSHLKGKLPKWKSEYEELKKPFFESLRDNNFLHQSTKFSQFEKLFSGDKIENFNVSPIKIGEKTSSLLVTLFCFLYNNEIIEMRKARIKLATVPLKNCFLNSLGNLMNMRRQPKEGGGYMHEDFINNILIPALNRPIEEINISYELKK